MRRISFYFLGGLIFCFGLSYGWPVLYTYGIIALSVLVIAMIYNAYRLANSQVILEINIQLPPIFTLGDSNAINITFKNTGWVGAFVEPVYLVAFNGKQKVLQQVLFEENLFFKPGEERDFTISYRPKTRGMVVIKPLEVSYFVRPHLLRRNLKIGAGWDLKVYPSILQMKQFNLLFSPNIKQAGRSIALRRIQEGFSYELEQILPFTAGDDPRKINWRVSGRKTELMVNRYQPDKRRDVYLVLDATRPMIQEGADAMMIFEYAINTALMLANIILQKGDRCGLLVVGKRTEIKVVLGGGKKQLKRILEALYQMSPTDHEGDFHKIESLVGRKKMLILCSHEDQMSGIHSSAFDRLIRLFPVIPILLSESISKNIKAAVLQAGQEYLSKRSI